MDTLPIELVRERALQIGRSQLGEKRVERVDVEDEIDASDQHSLSITFVLKPSKKLNLSGEKLGRINLEILDLLAASGDIRFPYTHYVTTDELKQLSAAE
ncbi:MAG TPA: hypothetical protein VMH86_15405 [Rhizomicrobium sp.]|nr:hypothetical protein [Rhizomicrobium sp.]